MLSLLFAKVRMYGALITGGVIAALLAALKYMSWRRAEAEERARRAEAFMRRDQEQEALEAEIDSKWSDYSREARENELETVPDILARPRHNK